MNPVYPPDAKTDLPRRSARAAARLLRLPDLPRLRPPSPLAGTPRAPWMAALLVLTILILTHEAPAPVGVFYDDGIYFDLARALAAGHGYRHDALPGAPPGVHYPPLYPLWLVAWSGFRPTALHMAAIAWLKLGNMLLTAAAVVPWALWAARRFRLHPWIAGAAVAASLLLVPARALTSVLFSEPLAWLILGLAFLAVHGKPDGSPIPLSYTVRSLATSALLGLLPLARMILLPFALAGGWEAVRTRETAPAVRITGGALCVGPAVCWWLWTSVHAGAIPAAWRTSYGSYSGMWFATWRTSGELLALAGHQALELGRAAGGVWTIPGAVIALAVTALGFRSLRAAGRVPFAGTLGYMVILVLWPAQPQRFLWGVLPLLVLLGVVGAASALAALAAHPVLRGALAVLLVLPAGTCTRTTLAGYRNWGWMVPQWNAAGAYAPLVAWSASLPRGTTVLTPNDPLFAAATGLPAAPALPPDLREDVGLPGAIPAARRLEASACTARTGWLLLPDIDDATGSAWRTLRLGPGSRVRFGPPIRVGARAVAVPFSCAPPDRTADGTPAARSAPSAGVPRREGAQREMPNRRAAAPDTLGVAGRVSLT
jgi:hypothetical protein